MTQDSPTEVPSERTYEDTLRCEEMEAQTEKVRAETDKIHADANKVEGETTSREKNDRWNDASSAKVEAQARMYNAIANLLPQLAAFLTSIVDLNKKVR